MHLALLTLYSFAMPAFRSPDEPNHIDVVRLLAHGDAYPAFDGRQTDPQVLAARDDMTFARKSRNLARGSAKPRMLRPSFDDLTPTQAIELNQLVQHPPLYYASLAAEFRLANALLPGEPFRAYDREVGALRLLSALWLAPLPLIVWRTSKRFGFSDSTSLVSSLIVLSIPQLQHLGSSVNNDTLFIAVSGCITLAIARILRGPPSRNVVAATGALIGLALFIKAFAFVYPLWLIAALIISARRHGKRFDYIGGAMACVLALAAGGWWWIRNLIRYGELAPSVETSNRLQEVPNFDPAWTVWIKEAILGVGKRFFGNFGWYDVWIPYRVMILNWIVIAIVVGIALFAPRRPVVHQLSMSHASEPATTPNPAARRNTSRVDAAMMFAPFVLLALFLGFNAARLYARSGVFALLQGRYLFGSIVGLCVVAGIACNVVSARAPAILVIGPVVALLGAVAMQVLAFRAILGFYWGEPGSSTVEQLQAMFAWSPWPRSFTIAVVAVAMAAATWMTICIARVSRFAGSLQPAK